MSNIEIKLKQENCSIAAVYKNYKWPAVYDFKKRQKRKINENAVFAYKFLPYGDWEPYLETEIKYYDDFDEV